VQQLASFHIPEPRMVIITPYDKNSLGAVEKAVRDSDLGVNPSNEKDDKKKRKNEQDNK